MFSMAEYSITNFLDALRARYRRAGRDVQFLPFNYNAEFLNLPVSSAVVSATNNTDHDADFVCFRTMQTAFVQGTSTLVFYPNILARIVAEISGRRLDSGQGHLVNTFGHGDRPFDWIRPWIINAKSSWSTEVQNLDAAQAFTLRLTYHGVKVIPIPFRA